MSKQTNYSREKKIERMRKRRNRSNSPRSFDLGSPHGHIRDARRGSTLSEVQRLSSTELREFIQSLSSLIPESKRSRFLSILRSSNSEKWVFDAVARSNHLRLEQTKGQTHSPMTSNSIPFFYPHKNLKGPPYHPTSVSFFYLFIFLVIYFAT